MTQKSLRPLTSDLRANHERLTSELLAQDVLGSALAKHHPDKFTIFKWIFFQAHLESDKELKTGDFIISPLHSSQLGLKRNYFLKCVKFLIEKGYLKEVYNASKSSLGLFTNERKPGRKMRERIVNVRHWKVFENYRKEAIRIFRDSRKPIDS